MVLGITKGRDPVKLTIRKPSYIHDEVRTLKLKWTAAPTNKGIAALGCSACGDKCGHRRIGIA